MTNPRRQAADLRAAQTEARATRSLHAALTAVKSLPQPSLQGAPEIGALVMQRLDPHARSECLDLLHREIRAWPEFSGYIDYPVRSPAPGAATPLSAAASDRRWDASTEYGAARWRLLDYLIEQTEPKP